MEPSADRSNQASSGPAQNRRASIRRKPKTRTKLEVRKGAMGFGPNLADSLLDVSQLGARAVIRGSLEVGQEIEVSLLGVGQARPVKILAYVVRAEPAGNDRTQIAIRFQKHLAYGDFQGMV